MRSVVLILALTVIGACRTGSPAAPDISTVQQLRAEIESLGVDCSEFEMIDPGAFALNGDFVSEAASCGSVSIAVLPARLEMSPAVQSVHRASKARTGAAVSAVAFGDTWIVSCDTDTTSCESIAEGLNGASAREEP